MARLRLRCIETGEEFPLTHDLLIGRDERCDIVLDSHEVSRRHARIVSNGSAVGIVDLESTNGTKVAGKVVPRAKLLVGQVVSLGDRSLLVVDDSPAENLTAIAAHVPQSQDSVVVDDASDDSTVFRGGYVLPPGWSLEDAAALGNSDADRKGSDRRLLGELLAVRGVTREQAQAALMLRGNNSSGRIFLLQNAHAPAWTIGRSPAVNIHLDHGTISGHHATIEHAQGLWKIIDHDSTNGVEVNGVRAKSLPLKAADIITLGSLSAIFDVIR